MTCHICKETDHIYKTCPNRIKVFTTEYNDRWITSGLFYETAVHRDDMDRVIYTLRPYDHMGFPSLHQLYLTYNDLTEYQFAKECLGSWDHWQTILSSERDKIHRFVNIWRSELEIKLKSDAFSRIQEEALADGRNGFAANKYIIDRAWAGEFSKGKPKDDITRGPGRPRKEDIKKAALDIALSAQQTDNDFDRIVGKE